MSFLTSAFAFAGLALAAGPIIIHLLNRRRFTVVDWAAMDFLKEAVQRQRRILTLRDIILLILRTLCVLLFGLAMARPYSESDSAVVSSGQPVHAILVVDNSLSMAYGTSGQTALDSAKKAAVGLVEDLPDGSRFSIIPLCGEVSDFSFDPEGTKDAATEAIKEIQVLDRTASVAKVVELAEEASKRAPDLPSKHIVFFGDQQRNCWPKGVATSGLLASIDKLNVVQVSSGDKDNIWIEDLRVQDEVADADATTVFIVRLRYQGEAAQDEVQVSLYVDGDRKPVSTKSVVLRDKQTREVLFTYKYEPDSSAVQSGFSRVKAEVSSHDKFNQDDVRYLSVPVLSGIPVVFIDQYGSDEDPARNRLGDTYYVRRLLTPSQAIDSKERQLIRIQHVKIDQVDTELLEYARLVVMAGVENPGVAVDVLREYVEQGGQLFIAAGGSFDPVAWNEEGWDGGRGILPSPLQPIAVGKLPGDGVKELNPFFISFDSLATDSFLPQEESNQNLEDIYSIPLFFKAVVADLEGDAMKNYLKVEREKIAAAEKAAQAAAAAGNTSVQPPAEKKGPTWLKWIRDLKNREEQLEPKILAKFTNDVPMLLERRIGAGQAVLFTSSISPDWNTLMIEDAVFVLDRILRGLLRGTLQKVNFQGSETVRLGVRAEERRNEFSLSRPQASQTGKPALPETLTPEARGLGGDEIVVRRVHSRGHYVVASYDANSGGSAGKNKVVRWSRPLAVNGPVEESELASTTESDVKRGLEEGKKDVLSWFSAGRDVGSGLKSVGGQYSWKYLMGIVLALLLVELLILSWGAIAGLLGPSEDEAAAGGEGVA